MKFREITSDEWSSLLRDQKHVSFFETPNWYSLWERYFNATTRTLLLDDDLLLSMIQLTGAKGLVNFKNSSPAGTYSNFRSLKGPLRLKQSDIKDIQKVTGVNFLRLSPFSNISIEGITDSVETEFTQYIDLLSIKNITEDWSRNHKRLYQKAIQESVSVLQTNQESDWKQYVNLYKGFIKNKGEKASSSYKDKLFESIFDLDTNERALWIVKRDKQLVAGRLVFYTKDIAIEWHACSLSKANEIGANQLLIYSIIQDAITRGIHIYDFNPSGGNKGVIAFKEKFGAQKRESLVFHQYSLSQQLYLWLKKSRGISIFRG